MRKSPRGKKPSSPRKRPQVSAPVSVVHVESSVLLPAGLSGSGDRQRTSSMAGDLHRPAKPLPPLPSEEEEEQQQQQDATRVNAFATMSRSSKALGNIRRPTAEA